MAQFPRNPRFRASRTSIRPTRNYRLAATLADTVINCHQRQTATKDNNTATRAGLRQSADTLRLIESTRPNIAIDSRSSNYDCLRRCMRNRSELLGQNSIYNSRKQV
jgi:hypothetical protein